MRPSTEIMDEWGLDLHSNETLAALDDYSKEVAIEFVRWVSPIESLSHAMNRHKVNNLDQLFDKFVKNCLRVTKK